MIDFSITKLKKKYFIKIPKCYKKSKCIGFTFGIHIWYIRFHIFYTPVLKRKLRIYALMKLLHEREKQISILRIGNIRAIQGLREKPYCTEVMVNAVHFGRFCYYWDFQEDRTTNLRKV